MKHISWNTEKNAKLRRERGIGFEDVLFQLNEGKILYIVDSPNNQRYPNQKVFVIEINEYIYYVPFVEDEAEIFLKTIIPSRKLKKQYLGELKE